MSENICEFCMRTFSSPGNMRKHQAAVKSCIQLQKNRGINAERKKFNCNLCARTYSTKYSLERHLKTNHSDQSTSSLNIRDNTVNGDGSIGIQANTNCKQVFILNFGDTFSELTPEKILVLTRNIMNSISVEATEAGIGTLTQEIAPLLLTNEKGNSVTRIADASRGKLAIINSQGEEEDDIKGMRTTELLRDPMKQVGMEHYNKSEKKDDVRRTLQTMTSKSEFNKHALPALLKVLPTEFKCSSSDEKLKEANDKSDNIIKTFFAELDKDNAKEGKNKCAKFIEELRDSHTISGNICWHPRLCFVMEMDEKAIPTIIGRQSKREDKMSDLTKADIKLIRKNGGKKLLHFKYLGDEAEGIESEKKKELAEEKARKAEKCATRKDPKELIERGDKIKAYLDRAGIRRTKSGLIYLAEPQFWLKMSDENLPTSDPDANVRLFEIVGCGPSQFSPVRDFCPDKLAELDEDEFLAPFIAKKYANVKRPRKLTLAEICNGGFPEVD